MYLFITEDLKMNELYPFIQLNRIKREPNQFKKKCHKREITVQGRGEAGLITTAKSSFNIREIPTRVMVKPYSRRSRRTLTLTSSTVIPMGKQGSKIMWLHWTKEGPSAEHCLCVIPRVTLGKSHMWSGMWLQTLFQTLTIKTSKDYLK